MTTNEDRAIDLILRAFDLPRSMHRDGGVDVVVARVLSGLPEQDHGLTVVEAREIAARRTVDTAATHLVSGDLDPVFGNQPLSKDTGETLKSKMARAVGDDLVLEVGDAPSSG